MRLIGIILLILWFAITVPTYDKWSYKAWYKRCEQRAKEESEDLY